MNIEFPLITVFTPIYNRAELLPKLFKSLVEQTSHNFEWIIVDDGSTDNISTVVKQMQQSNPDFTIIFQQQSNHGKHTAINRGVELAQGELFMVVDSDDSLPPTSLESIAKQYEKVKGNYKIGGVCGCKAALHTHHKSLQQPTFNKYGVEEIVTNQIDIRYKYGIQGDMCEVIKTDVMRQFPFPVYEGERFCPEALIFNRIATKYDLIYFNKITYFYEYLPGGLTDKIVAIRMKSPLASTLYYSELIRFDIPLLQKIKTAINFYRFCACIPQGQQTPQGISSFWLWCKPLGWLMHLRDRKLTKK